MAGPERVLALEGIYLDIEALWPYGTRGLRPRAVEDALRDAVGEGFFEYDRLALSEEVLDRVDDGFRLLVYSEFRRRYEDPAWNELVEPARGALTSLSQEELKSLERSLIDVKQQIETIPGTMRHTHAGMSRGERLKRAARSARPASVSTRAPTCSAR